MDIITQEERWVEIEDFPGYLISDHGNVMNEKRGTLVRASSKGDQGYMMVGLMQNGFQRKRSLPLLVAMAYLPSPTSEAFDTPIHLDGDRANNHYRNLMWRPLWFARRYMAQFTDNHHTYAAPIEDIETGERYDSSMHACMYNGLLDTELIMSMHNNGYVWPTGQVFRKAL